MCSMAAYYVKMHPPHGHGRSSPILLLLRELGDTRAVQATGRAEVAEAHISPYSNSYIAITSAAGGPGIANKRNVCRVPRPSYPLGEQRCIDDNKMWAAEWRLRCLDSTK